MSLSKLMKEEGKRSKSASPKVTPGPENNGNGTVGTGAGAKVEKRKQEEEAGEEDLSKRAKIEDGVDSATQAVAESVPQTVEPPPEVGLSAVSAPINVPSEPVQASSVQVRTDTPVIDSHVEQDQPMTIPNVDYAALSNEITVQEPSENEVISPLSDGTEQLDADKADTHENGMVEQVQ